jgi:hypothetical protein
MSSHVCSVQGSSEYMLSRISITTARTRHRHGCFSRDADKCLKYKALMSAMTLHACMHVTRLHDAAGA